MKKQTFYKAINEQGMIHKEEVKAYPYTIPGSKYHFFVMSKVDDPAEKVSNVETGVGLSSRVNVENPPAWFSLTWLDDSIEEALRQLGGDIKDMPESGVKIETFLSVFSSEFKAVFGVALEKFYRPVMGFDVIYFDEKLIKPAEGTSTAQAVSEKYGESALDLVNRMLDYEKTHKRIF